MNAPLDGNSADTSGAPTVPVRVDEARRLLVFALFIAALTATSLGETALLFGYVVGGFLGYLLAVGLHLLWGERTRPKAKPLWYLMALALLVLIVMMGFARVGPNRGYATMLPLALGVGLLFRHDNGMAPTLMIAGTVWSAVMQPEFDPRSLGDADATWIAIATLLAIAAATFEHERLMRREGAGTAGAWTTIRLAFVSLFTIIVLSLREEVQWGRVFTLFGADLRGQSGQMLLIGILLIALVVAAFALKPGKRREEAPRR